MITLVLAVAHNGVIGRNNDLPWPRLKEDMKRFRSLTMGGVVVMGRKTWESLPKKLDGRVNVVLSRSTAEIEGADLVLSSVDEIRTLDTYPSRPIHVIGGATLFEQAQPLAEVIHLTRVFGSYDGDVRIDEDRLLDGFAVEAATRIMPAADDQPVLSFERYRREVSQ